MSDVARIELAPGYSISRVVNGGWQLSEGHGPTIDREAVIQDLLRLQEAGLTTFDCADIYTGVEELYGDFLRRYRRRTGDRELVGVQIHTKCVPDLSDLPTLGRRDVEKIVDRSLRRLGVERLDLVQLHWWDYSIPGCVDAAGWLDDLRHAGKIRLLGATNFDVARLREIVAAGIEIASHQVQYSLLDRRPEHGMTHLCAEHGIHLLCYGTLAGGFLAERYRHLDGPGEPANRSLAKYRLIVEEAGGWDAYQQLLDTLHAIADRHGVSLSGVAVRWVLDRPRVAATIVGARDSRHLGDNLRVLALRLDEQDQRHLDEASARLRPLAGDTFGVERVPGGRHARIMKTGLNREGEG
ncbi:MAG: aldo/keto reductase [bacterium]|nr:aldo/keto reductase [bacterium]